MADLGILDLDIVLHASVWKAKDLKDACESADRYIEEWVGNCFCDRWIGALGGPNNYRDLLYDNYKKSAARTFNRRNRPSWFYDLKSYLSSKSQVSISEYNEADDLVRIWYNQASKLGLDSVIISGDKDLNCIPGVHFDFRKEQRGVKDDKPGQGFFVVTEDQAQKQFWKQMLIGDSMDAIPGVRGIGPKKTNPILETYGNDAKSLRDAVRKEYERAYGNDWKNFMLLNAKLLHIQRWDYDWITLEELLESDSL
jgi:5'-3' exonuclease